MKFYILFIIFPLFIILTKSRLLMVIELFRHGAREPTSDENWWNANDFKHKEDLTSVGMRQMYNLGKFLRTIYINDLEFLSPKYEPDEIYVQSAELDRCLVSAVSHLYGLYPVGNGPTIPKNVDSLLLNPPFSSSFQRKKHYKFGFDNAFQPIPVHNVPNSEDFLTPLSSNCPIINYFDEVIQNSPFMKNLTTRYNDTFFKEELGSLINLTKEQIYNLTLLDISGIYDVFMVDKYAAKPLPTHISPLLKKNLELIYGVYKLYTHTGLKEAVQFYSTPFLNNLIQNFNNTLNGSNQKLKWIMYSIGYDSLAIFSAALNFTSYQCVEEIITTGNTSSLNCALKHDFAENLLLELHEVKGKNIVKARFNGEYVYLCEKKEKNCDWDEFVDRIYNFTVDYDSICQLSSLNLDLSSFENSSQSFSYRKIRNHK